jgi:hypothetical protein
MVMLLVLLVPLASFVAAVLVTRKKAVFVISHWVPVLATAEDQAPAGSAEAGSAYRGAPLVTRREQVEASHATRSLPRLILETASLCRLAVCVASVFVVPVLFGAFLDDHVGATFYLGWPGLVLAAGQLAARRSLLAGTPRSPAVASIVGGWTILHNLVVIACVCVCSQGDGNTPSDWYALRSDAAGVVFVLYAVCSITLGVLLCSAATAQRRWLAAHGALLPVGERTATA